VSRSIVGSWPHRRTLPEGREAIERALAHCDAAAMPTPRLASMLLGVQPPRLHGVPPDAGTRSDRADWLPSHCRTLTREALRALLREESQP
jgi:hypothetical protein